MTTEQLGAITNIDLLKQIREAKSKGSPIMASHEAMALFEIAFHTARLADAQERTNEWLGRIESAIRDTEAKAWLMEIASQLTIMGQKP